MRFWLGLLTISLLLGSTPLLPAQPEFIRGDCNGDRVFNMGDPAYLFLWLFVGHVPLPCQQACDADDDDAMNGLIDGIYMLNALFTPGSPTIPAPFPACGTDPSAGPLACDVYDCVPPVSSDPDPFHILHMSDSIGLIDTTEEVTFFLDNPDGFDTVAWSWSICHDPSLVAIDDVVDGATTLTVRNGEPPHFSSVAIFPGQGWTVGVVTSFFWEYVLPPDIDHELHIATYELLAEGISTLDYCTLGDPPVEPVVIVIGVPGSYITPSTIPGTIETVLESFRRGDANGDGIFNGLVDALYILFFSFVPGSPSPICFDAADVNDDGGVGFVDVIYLLNYQFLQGPAPPPPGAFTCGVDPTPDTIGCDNPGTCP